MTQLPTEDREKAQKKHVKSLVLINTGDGRGKLTSAWGIPLLDVVETVKSRPDFTNIVITGRNAPKELIEIANTVSRVENVKHAYQMGILAKRGIDF